MNPPALRALIADSLTLWGVAGRVDIADLGVRITINDLVLHVTQAAPEEAPMRWWLISETRRRPAASMLGLLRSLRYALGATSAEPARARVAAPP
ncbi:MAG: hypothetical protein INF75_14000 [Roseomonas sp.]|nr:hypothetical protein [Roseomonas sp.]MCA3328600.1 hypothetical protein [Roseomonas sp.]MCA3331591.1 hypothetical protein [Roseomonas sp.]MCA3336366.1 hypothetical protein [Roseomonas sp.]MCA3346393.1 hypothetical protein [Roseomonas sp.]